jgi:hypothetical protein
MVGIGANASRDMELRREIYRNIKDHPDIFKNLGLAEMQREIESKVIPLNNKIELAGYMKDYVDPSQEDVKIIISEALTEIQFSKSHTKSKD